MFLWFHYAFKRKFAYGVVDPMTAISCIPKMETALFEESGTETGWI